MHNFTAIFLVKRVSDEVPRWSGGCRARACHGGIAIQELPQYFWHRAHYTEINQNCCSLLLSRLSRMTNTLFWRHACSQRTQFLSKTAFCRKSRPCWRVDVWRPPHSQQTMPINNACASEDHRISHNNHISNCELVARRVSFSVFLIASDLPSYQKVRKTGRQRVRVFEISYFLMHWFCGACGGTTRIPEYRVSRKPVVID